ncbi:MAG: hypothetical protein ACRYG2_32250 [Janthinobacterium lividum]
MSTDQVVARAGSALLGDVVILVRDALTVFVRLFPQIMAVWLLGWLGDSLAVQVAAIVGDHSGWAAVVVFSSSFLFILVAVVVILRLCGEELGISALIPREEAVEDDGRDRSLSRLVAVTLLPFLGLYSAFGLVNDKAGQLTVIQQFRGGLLDPPSVLSSVRGLASHHSWWMVALLVGLYALRRLVDHLHERTRLGLLGILTAVVESLFILVVIFGGFLLLRRPGRWLADREVVVWLDGAGRALEHALAALHLRLPELLHRFGAFLADPVWPMFWTTVSQPVIWLAVAALVYGSQVLSLADLWRQGRPVASRVIGASRFDRRSDKRALLPVAPAGVARIGGEVKEAFLGDIDDKYLPTFHSVRLVLRAGAPFLGAFVLVYTAVLVAQSSVQQLYLSVLGGRDIDFWYRVDPFLDLLDDVPWEPLRLCLLAVAFRRCLELFQQRGADPADETARRAGRGAGSPVPGHGGGRRTTSLAAATAEPRRHRVVARSRVVAAMAAILLVTVAAIAHRVSDPVGDYQLVRAPLDSSTAYQTGRVRISDVRVGSVIVQGDDRSATKGLFVVVNVAVQASGHDDVTAGDSRLVTPGGVTYLPAFGLASTITAHPGFETSSDLVYEVDPTRFDDLTLEVWSSGLVYRYYQRTQTPLGITAANAPRWAQAGAGRVVVVPGADVTKALS